MAKIEILYPEEQEVCCRCPSKTIIWNKEKTMKICPICGCEHGVTEDGNPYIKWWNNPDTYMDDTAVGEWYKDKS